MPDSLFSLIPRAISKNTTIIITFFVITIFFLCAIAVVFANGEDTCIECHSDPEFLVTNKKLYDYYQQWKTSIHGQEEVGCSDCHGGNSELSDKVEAHESGQMGAAAKDAGPVSYQNVPETCGDCHDDIYEQYIESKHYEKLTEEKKKEDQTGPNCVTCHGSVNNTVLKVVTVKETCERCHNEESDNNPDFPDRAEVVLNQFLSMHRFYRYFTKNNEFFTEQDTYRYIEEQTTALFIEWHTFDLDKIERRTRILLDFMKNKRNEIRMLIKARSS